MKVVGIVLTALGLIGMTVALSVFIFTDPYGLLGMCAVVFVFVGREIAEGN